MKHLLLRFLSAWVISAVLRVLAGGFSIAAWLFGNPPVWAVAALVVMTLLPFPLLAFFGGRKFGCATSWDKTVVRVAVLLSVEFFVCLALCGVYILSTQHNGILAVMLCFPYLHFSGVFGGGGAFVMVSLLVEPMLYCVGWFLGGKTKIVDIAS